MAKDEDPGRGPAQQAKAQAELSKRVDEIMQALAEAINRVGCNHTEQNGAVVNIIAIGTVMCQAIDQAREIGVQVQFGALRGGFGISGLDEITIHLTSPDINTKLSFRPDAADGPPKHDA